MIASNLLSLYNSSTKLRSNGLLNSTSSNSKYCDFNKRKYCLINNLFGLESDIAGHIDHPYQNIKLVIKKINLQNPAIKFLDTQYTTAETAFEHNDFKESIKICKSAIEFAVHSELRNDIPKFLKLINKSSGLSEEYL